MINYNYNKQTTTFGHIELLSAANNDRHWVQVWDMVEERALQLAPPPGVAALDPLMQLQQNLAALNQVLPILNI